jgi:hypothetical protein
MNNSNFQQLQAPHEMGYLRIAKHESTPAFWKKAGGQPLQARLQNAGLYSEK